MYTSGRSVKSTARKLATGLTVQKATRDARRIVEQVMPGVGATVTSRISWDFDSDRQTVVTTITFPETADSSDLACWAERVSGAISSTWSCVRLTVTRAV